MVRAPCLVALTWRQHGWHGGALEDLPAAVWCQWLCTGNGGRLRCMGPARTKNPNRAGVRPTRATTSAARAPRAPARKSQEHRAARYASSKGLLASAFSVLAPLCVLSPPMLPPTSPCAVPTATANSPGRRLHQRRTRVGCRGRSSTAGPDGRRGRAKSHAQCHAHNTRACVCVRARARTGRCRRARCAEGWGKCDGRTWTRCHR